ncbi:Hypothetical predicted protein [Olea europaea subsp. europaea]|uniref:Uncharacterized protein n=1 Tax=Olea europaea subsp. europaea TaxID=158383 RepID=A0A8S0Q2Q9_OLEEU|nr:Hypothetical predicted protein [Olea europaea subsp. europaea]
MELDGTILENFQVPSSTGLMEMNGDSLKATGEPSAIGRADIDVPLVVVIPCIDDAVVMKKWRLTHSSVCSNDEDVFHQGE